MAHYDCSCCGESFGIGHAHCDECKAGRCPRGKAEIDADTIAAAAGRDLTAGELVSMLVAGGYENRRAQNSIQRCLDNGKLGLGRGLRIASTQITSPPTESKPMTNDDKFLAGICDELTPPLADVATLPPIQWKNMSAANIEGQNARDAGHTISSNPHSTTTQEWAQFRTGWLEREQVIRKAATVETPASPPEHDYAVKSWPQFFEPMVAGRKLHDMRNKRDRQYKVGDRMLLCEFDPFGKGYTGRYAVAVITYITSNDTPCALSSVGLGDDMAILSVKVGPVFENADRDA
jgi:hypothetical protein